MKADEKEMKEENEKLNEEVEVEGFFMTVKEINDMNREPEASYFICPKMSRFIKIYRMKFYLFSR